MSSCLEEYELSPYERELAREHWDALMFAPNRIVLESARLALTRASFPIQHAVIADITQRWLHEYQPCPEDNPFRPAPFLESTIETKEESVSAPQIEVTRTESPQSHSIWSCTPRLMQALKGSFALGGRAISPNSLHRATADRW